MTIDTNEWLAKYADTFYNVYWTGPKRPILEKFRKLAGTENYILYVEATKSSKLVYHFTDKKMISHDIAEFPHLSICFPDGMTIKGLDQILDFAEMMHSKFPKRFVLAIFDTHIDNETVTRIPAFFFDGKQ